MEACKNRHRVIILFQKEWLHGYTDDTFKDSKCSRSKACGRRCWGGSTDPKTQCAAVTIHCGCTRVPPHTWRRAHVRRRETTQGQRPSDAGSPPTIILVTATPHSKTTNGRVSSSTGYLHNKNVKQNLSTEDISLLEFMYLVFTCVSGELTYATQVFAVLVWRFSNAS